MMQQTRIFFTKRTEQHLVEMTLFIPEAGRFFGMLAWVN